MSQTKKRSLFDKKDPIQYNEDGQRLSKETLVALGKLLRKYRDAGFSELEIENILMHSASVAVLFEGL